MTGKPEASNDYLPQLRRAPVEPREASDADVLDAFVALAEPFPEIGNGADDIDNEEVDEEKAFDGFTEEEQRAMLEQPCIDEDEPNTPDCGAKCRDGHVAAHP